MNLRPYRPILFLLLAILFTGLLFTGCRVMRVQNRGGGGEEEGEGGGGVAGSASYKLDRAEIGYSLKNQGSLTYRSSAKLGAVINQPEAISDKYSIRHPFTKEILELPPTLQAEADQMVQELREQRANRSAPIP